MSDVWIYGSLILLIIVTIAMTVMAWILWDRLDHTRYKLRVADARGDALLGELNNTRSELHEQQAKWESDEVFVAARNRLRRYGRASVPRVDAGGQATLYRARPRRPRKKY